MPVHSLCYGVVYLPTPVWDLLGQAVQNFREMGQIKYEMDQENYGDQ